MKKQVLFLLVILITIQLALATITIDSPPLEKYKIGELIDISATVNTDYDEQAFVSATIDCPNDQLNFFKIPFTSNFIDIPAIIVDENFVGECEIQIALVNSEDTIIEQINSDPIQITNKLELEFSIDKEAYNPGEKILLEGTLESDTELTVKLTDSGDTIKEYSETIINSQFSIIIDLEKNLRAGEKSIQIIAEDDLGNNVEDSISISINQIPSSIELSVDQAKLDPKESASFKALVKDQTENLMISTITYRVYDPEENIIESLTSNERILLELSGFSPGEYLVKASFKDLENTGKFAVKEVKEIDLVLEENIITISNIGNVRYIEDFTFEAKIEETVYQIPISLDLNINEKMLVDLKSEIPSGTYDLKAVTKQGTIEPGSIEIVSNRPAIKKLSQGLAQVTGSAIIETDKVGNIFYLGFFLVFIGFILVFIVNRKFKKNINQVVDDTIVVQGKQNKGLKSSLSKNQKEKSMIKDMFGSYVDHKILKKNFKSEIMKKEISILFTDIRGFSKIFDNYDSKEIAEMLNVYFSNASRTIKKNNGFINKFIGDSVMALFNAASKDENHLLNTVRSAIEMKNEMAEINKKLKAKNLEAIEVGYGIDSGNCAVGTIGSKEKLEFTAIGAPVNIAFRLQSISDGSILITERVYKKIKTKIKAKLYGEYEMKNITGKVKVYKVFGIN